MATESINEIISKEAIDSIIQLSQKLDEVTDKMEGLIGKVSSLNEAMNATSGAKATAEAIGSQAKATEELNKTNSDRLNLEREIKEKGKEMVAALKNEADYLANLDNILAQNIKSKKELAVGMAKVQTQIDKNRKSLKDLKKDYQDGNVAIGDYNDKQADIIEKNITLQTELSNYRKELKLVETDLKSNDGSVQQFSGRLSQLKNIWKGLSHEQRNAADVGGVLENEINSLDETIKGLEKSIGENFRSVGTYEVALDGIENKIPGVGKNFNLLTNLSKMSAKAMGQGLVNGIKEVGKAFLGLLANPIFLVLAGLAMIIMGIVKAFKKNEEQMQALTRAFAPLKAAMKAVLWVFEQIAKVLVKAIEGIAKFAGGIMKMAEKLPFVGDAIKNINEEMAAQKKLVEDQQNLEKSHRENIVQNAKDEYKISILRAEAADKNKYSAEERIKMLKKANSLAEVIAKREKKEASLKLSIAVREYNDGEKTKEQLGKIAELKAAIYKADEDYYALQKSNQRAINQAENEIENDKQDKINKWKEAKTKEAAFIKELTESIKQIEYDRSDKIEQHRKDLAKLEEDRQEKLKKYPKEQALIDQEYFLEKKQLDKKHREYLDEQDKITAEKIDKKNNTAIKKAAEQYDELAHLAKLNYENEINEAIIAGITGEELEQKKYEAKLKWNLKEIELFEENKKALIDAGMSEEDYYAKLVKMRADNVEDEQEAQRKIKEAVLESAKVKRQATVALTEAYISLGGVLAQNIESEKQRVKVEAAVALAQALVAQGLEIIETIKEDKGDSYTKAVRIAVNVAAIVAAMSQATASFKEAQSIVPYAEGTMYHKGGAALIGEAGEPEIVMIAGKNPIVIDKPTVVENLPIGAKVIPTSKIDNIMSLAETNELLRGLNDKPIVNVNVSDEITAYIQRKLDLTKVIGGYFKA